MRDNAGRVSLARLALWGAVKDDPKLRAHFIEFVAEFDRIRADNAFLRREKATAWGKVLEDRPASICDAIRRLVRNLTRGRSKRHGV